MRNTFTLFRRSMTHIVRSPETIFSAMLQPVMLMLLFVYVFGGALKASLPDGANYVNYQLPGILIMAVGYNTAYTALRMFSDKEKRHIQQAELHADPPFLIFMGACAVFYFGQPMRARGGLFGRADHGLPFRRGHFRVACRSRRAYIIHACSDVGRRHSGAAGKDGGRILFLGVPAGFSAAVQFILRADADHAEGAARFR